jgi:ATP-dependent Zn protease
LAVQTLTENRELLGQVTQALLEKRELDSRQIAMLVGPNEPYQPTEETDVQGTDTLVM